jgi:hypothetical protein
VRGQTAARVLVGRVEAGATVREFAAPPPAGARVIDGEAVIVDRDSGDIVAIQALGDTEPAARLARALGRVHFDAPLTGKGTSANEARLSGVIVSNRVFGFGPPVPLRQRWHCGQCALDRQHPDIAAMLAGVAQASAAALARLAPAEAERTARLVADRIARPWLIGGTAWTSGIINNNAALPYHRDAGNVRGSWSAMLMMKRACVGGWLHLADWDVWLAVPDGSLTLFDGGRWLHGVTPFRVSHPKGYRLSTVFYARAGMARCAPDPADEPARAARAATAANERRAR